MPKIIAIFLLFFIAKTLTAQTYKPDPNGYIANPKFHQLLKDKGYSLVGKFDTLQKNPLMLAAKAVYNGKSQLIDVRANIIPEDQIPGYRTYNGDMSMGDAGITISSHDYGRNDPYQQININGRLGTVHKTSQQKGLDAAYDNLTYISENLLKIEKDGKKGLAQSNGVIIKKPQYQDISLFDSYNDRKKNELFQIRQNDKYGLISKTGQVVLPAKYDDLSYLPYADNSGRLILFSSEKKKGIANSKGQVLLLPAYDEIRVITKGLFLVSMQTQQGKRYGLIDTLGKTILSPGLSQPPKYLHEQRLLQINEGNPAKAQVGLMNLSGKMLVPPVYQELVYFKKQIVVVEKDRKFGAISLLGTEVLPCSYDVLYIDEKASLIVVERGQKRGLTDLTGKPVLPLIYDDLLLARNGTVVISQAGKWNRMNLKTKAAVSLPYDYIEPNNNILIVKKADKSGVLDLEGNVLFPVQYPRIRDAYHAQTRGIITIEIDRERFLVDRYGNEVPQRGSGY
ncbi:hypothetical protein HDC92_002711 [Pedobacter sp. AK017]|uniref:WG repeat-containing protein n=1 Tax=Pedobacter sp. AK017 TaxID=2723073 RepID=UPI00160830AD|nr:WG repeat-containing protein [Pedobacter sp. AK017]MBB5439027.1 hypothetical protein [Pedobacter sp. AK017]